MAFESLVGNTTDAAPAGREFQIDPEIIIRRSTGPARIADAAQIARRV
jgi:hypothetical protein